MRAVKWVRPTRDKYGHNVYVSRCGRFRITKRITFEQWELWSNETSSGCFDRLVEARDHADELLLEDQLPGK